MRRFVPVLVTSLVCSLTAAAVPPAQKAEEKGPSKNQKPGEKRSDNDLEGTKWNVLYNNNNNLFTVFEFRKGGVFVCGGNLTGTWKRDGNSVRMRTPDGAEFEGTVKGDTMSGKVVIGKGERATEYSWKGKKE